MSARLAAAYPWIKAFHIIAVIAWMAGLLYLPRLYVYHAEAPAGSRRSETFKIMERRLLRGIMVPAMAATLVFGVLLAATPGLVDWRLGWIWVKLGLVLLLILFQSLLARWRTAFASDANRRSPRFFRMINELPTLAMLAIVVLVVVKPF
ncbi:MAG: protoporphyrinogen oxidase HemJ [Alphaproteobacteria bacterium]|nr:protoporphyrinogen oxidase HemJ [Alphaproteobacteria bacterium]